MAGQMQRAQVMPMPFAAMHIMDIQLRFLTPLAHRRSWQTFPSHGPSS